MKTQRVAIYGASGFAGAELLRRMLLHDGLEVVRVAAADHLGEPVASAHPHLEGLSDLVFEPVPRVPPKDVDLFVLGLPHTVSAALVGALEGTGARVLDLSGAFRLGSAEAYAACYGEPHPSPELVPRFVYGLPELNRADIAGASRVASPGCFATAITLALLPLARAGMLTGSVPVVGITGSSGSGATPSLGTHHPIRAQNLKAYRPLLHPHAPEVEASLARVGANTRIDFVPVSAPLTRGILVTAFPTLSRAVSEAELSAAFDDCYASDRLVRRPRRRLPEVVAVSGSCYAEVGFALEGPRLTVFAALDNLIKGGAGQAIQNVNLMCGFDETTALTDPGGYP